MASRSEWRANQRLMNKALGRMGIKGIKPVIEDGIPGPSTRKMIHDLKFFLGWDKDRSKSFTKAFHYAIKYPFSNHWVGGPNVIARGRKRVREHNRAWDEKEQVGHATSGVTTFDGVSVATWLVPYPKYARARGWRGQVVSGFRTPEYSEGLCYRMCGRPSCPGRCAGRTTNHAQNVKPRGALDVTDYYKFAQIMRTAPFSPRIFNALGARDPVHFSSTGR